MNEQQKKKFSLRRFLDNRGYLVNLAQSSNYSVVLTNAFGLVIGLTIAAGIAASSSVLRYLSDRNQRSGKPTPWYLSDGANSYLGATLSLANSVIGFIGPMLGFGHWDAKTLGLSAASLVGSGAGYMQGTIYQSDQKKGERSAAEKASRNKKIFWGEVALFSITLFQAFAAGMNPIALGAYLVVSGVAVAYFSKAYPNNIVKQSVDRALHFLKKPLQGMTSLLAPVLKPVAKLIPERFKNPVYSQYLTIIGLTAATGIASLISAAHANTFIDAFQYLLFAASRGIHIASTDAGGRHEIRKHNESNPVLTGTTSNVTTATNILFHNGIRENSMTNIVRVQPTDSQYLEQISAIAQSEDVVLQKKILKAVAEANAQGASIEVKPFLNESGGLSLVDAYQIFKLLPRPFQKKIETEGYLVSGYGPETYKEWAASNAGVFAYVDEGKVIGFITAYAPEDNILASDRGSYFTRTEFGQSVWQVKQITTSAVPEHRQKGVAKALSDHLNRFVAEEAIKRGQVKVEIMAAIVDTPNNSGSKLYHEAQGYGRVADYDRHPDGIIRGIYGLELNVYDLSHRPAVPLQQRKLEQQVKQLQAYIQSASRRSRTSRTLHSAPVVNRPAKARAQGGYSPAPMR